MSDSPVCPSFEKLKELAGGVLPEPQARSLEEHLLECDACARQTAQLHQTDTLLVAMKQAMKLKATVSTDEQARLERLMDSLNDLPARHLEATNRSTPPGFLNADNPSDDVIRELGSAWRPAVEANEIGHLGIYRILKVLGAGGMGAVFLAEDSHLQRKVALKMMRPRAASNPDAAERFLREARAAAALRHDHILTIYQVGEEAGVPYLAMEYLEGESLEDRLKREITLPIADVLCIGREIAEGLAAAHAKGLIHRDIKPANVWLERRNVDTEVPESRPIAVRNQRRNEKDSGNSSGVSRAPDAASPVGFPLAKREDYNSRVKLLDFGLARSADVDIRLTSSGMIMGTPSYMAPEQASCEVVDARSDLFSLGVVLYRMTTGQLPFPGKNVMEILKSLVTITPAAPRSHNPNVPRELSELIQRLLAKEANARPNSASAVARQLAEIELTDARIGDPNWIRSIPRRNALALTGLAAVALLAIVIVTITRKDGKEIEVAINVPEGVSSISTTVREETVSKAGAPRTGGVDRPESGHNKPVKGDVGSKAGIAERSVIVKSPFDALDPAMVPVEERFDWQPKELVAVLGSHRQRLWEMGKGVALSADGTLAAAGGGLTCTIFESEKDQRFEIAGTPSFGSVALSPDGRQLFCNSGSAVTLSVNTGEIWERRSLPTGRTLPSASQPHDAEFSLDGRFLTTSVFYGMVIDTPHYSTLIWDVSVDPPRLVVELPGFKNASLSPDGNRLAVVDVTNSSVKIFDISPNTPELFATLPDTTTMINWSWHLPTHGFLTNGMLATIDSAARMVVWDVSTKTPTVVAERTITKMWGLRPFRSGAARWLVFDTVSTKMWSLNGNEIVEAPFGFSTSSTNWSQANILDVAISQDGRRVVSAHLNGMVRLGEVCDWGFREIRPLKPQPASANSLHRVLAIAPDGRHLTTCSEDGFNVWSMGRSAAQILICDETSTSNFAPVGFSDNQHFITAGVNNGNGAQLWNLNQEHVDRPKSLQDKDWFGQHLLVTNLLLMQNRYRHSELSLWNLDQLPAKITCTWSAAPEGREISLNPKVYSSSADGRTLVTLDTAPESPTVVRVWQRTVENVPPTESASFDVVPAGGGSVFQIAMSPDGQHLAIAGRAGLSCWDLTGNQWQRRWNYGVYANAVAFNSDATLIAVYPHAVESNNVALIEVESGRTTRQWEYPTAAYVPAVSDLAFAPDDRHLLTANFDGTVYVLRLSE